MAKEKVMMDWITPEQREAIARKYGPSTAEALSPIVGLIAGHLANRDLVGLSFVFECLSAVVSEADGQAHTFLQYETGTLQ